MAYTNSIGGSTATRLFGIDTSLNTLTQFGPGNADPNTGVMTTRGPLGVDVDAVAGFDIAPGGGRAAAGGQRQAQAVLDRHRWPHRGSGAGSRHDR